LPLFRDIEDAGLTVVHTKMNRGYIANYVLFQEIAASIMLIEKFGYDTKTIDLVLGSLGRQSSVFDVIDFVGVDVTKKILENLHETDHSVIVPPVLNVALESGILGRKNKTSIRSVLDNYQHPGA
jgi:3-hydroxyacyl-CoA dehydrogenase